MPTSTRAVFAKVDPKKILIDPRYVKPTNWDLMAVDEDVFEYVQLSRVVKAHAGAAHRGPDSCSDKRRAVCQSSERRRTAINGGL